MELNKKQIFKWRLETSRMFPYSIARLCLIIPIRQHVNNMGLVTLGKDFIGFSDELYDLDYPTMKDVLAHSIIYYQFKHRKRSISFTTDKVSKIIWNIASEICRSSFMNMYIKAEYKKEGKRSLKAGDIEFASPENMGLPEGLSVEQYYDILYRNYLENKNIIENIQTGSQISYETDTEQDEDYTEKNIEEAAGDIKEADTGEIPEDIDSVGQLDMESQIEIEATQTIKNAISTIARGFNSIGGELQYFTENPEARDRKRINKLRRILHTCIHSGPGRRITGPRPRRRAPGEIKIMEDIKVGFKPTAVIVDVSGSTENIRDQIYDVLATTIRATNLIDVYIGDVTILSKKKGVSRPKQINGIPSGLGTNMGAIMKELDKLNKYHAIFVITDGITPWPEEPLKAKCFVFLVGDAYGVEVDIPNWIIII